MCLFQVHPAPVFPVLHSAPRLLLPPPPLPHLPNLKASPGRLEDPARPRANRGFKDRDLGQHPSLQLRSPPNPTTTLASPASSEAERREEFEGLDLVSDRGEGMENILYSFQSDRKNNMSIFLNIFLNIGLSDRFIFLCFVVIQARSQR